MAAEKGWVLMQDGVVWTMFNHQSGDRGGDEFVAPNWWMLMAQRATSRGTIVLWGMLSLDAATVGSDGYREIFQAGETSTDTPSSIGSIRTICSCSGCDVEHDGAGSTAVAHRRGLRFVGARPPRSCTARRR